MKKNKTNNSTAFLFNIALTSHEMPNAEPTGAAVF
jgi:hypothetical protein